MFTMGQTVVTIRRLKVVDEERGREVFLRWLTASNDAWEQATADYEASRRPSKTVWRVEHQHRGLSFFRPVLRDLCFWDDFETPESALVEFDLCSETLTNPGLVGGLAGWAREIGASVRDCWRWMLFRFKRPYWASPSAREETVNNRRVDRYAAEQRELVAAEQVLAVGAAGDAMLLAADPSQPESWARFEPEDADALLGCPE